MNCAKCGKNDAIRSVEYILSEGTVETNSQTDVHGHTNSSFKSDIHGYETFQGERTGLEYSGQANGTASAATYEVHTTNTVSQTRLAAKLSNVFGPYLDTPELVANEAAIAHLTKANEKKRQFYGWAAIIFVGSILLEFNTTGFILYSVILGGPVAAVLAGIGWFLDLGTESEALAIASKSTLNKKRAKMIKDFNRNLDDLYLWLSTMGYCSRCNVLTDDGEFFELAALAATRPKKPRLPK